MFGDWLDGHIEMITKILNSMIICRLMQFVGQWAEHL
jgi:hypothetical protein